MCVHYYVQVESSLYVEIMLNKKTQRIARDGNNQTPINQPSNDKKNLQCKRFFHSKQKSLVSREQAELNYFFYSCQNYCIHK